MACSRTDSTEALDCFFVLQHIHHPWHLLQPLQASISSFPKVGDHFVFVGNLEFYGPASMQAWSTQVFFGLGPLLVEISTRFTTDTFV